MYCSFAPPGCTSIVSSVNAAAMRRATVMMSLAWECAVPNHDQLWGWFAATEDGWPLIVNGPIPHLNAQNGTPCSALPPNTALHLTRLNRGDFQTRFR
jgi:hypothetical protein